MLSVSLESYHAVEHYSPFLRFETPRQKFALPYATLLAIQLSTDDTTLELEFAAKRVIIRGKRLQEIFCAICGGHGEVLIARMETAEIALGPNSKVPLIFDILTTTTKHEN